MLFHHFALWNYCEYALLNFLQKRVFLITIFEILVSLNQHHGEIGIFYNRLASQITKLTSFLFYILLNFTKNVLIYSILIVNMMFLTLLDQFSSCNIIYVWNFMIHLFYSYFTFIYLFTSLFGKFVGYVWLTYVMWRYWIESRSKA